jgi:hypothetical protein
VFFAFIGAERESLDRRSGRSRRRFSAGRAKQTVSYLWVRVLVLGYSGIYGEEITLMLGDAMKR